MRVWSLRALAQVLVVCLFSLFLEANFQNTFAQSDLGKISGFIIDQSGAPVPNAKITVRNQSGIERQATTNDTGYYLISNVPPGFYAQRVRDIIYQPGYSNWNMGLFKAFRSTKRWTPIPRRGLQRLESSELVRRRRMQWNDQHRTGPDEAFHLRQSARKGGGSSGSGERNCSCLCGSISERSEPLVSSGEEHDFLFP